MERNTLALPLAAALAFSVIGAACAAPAIDDGVDDSAPVITPSKSPKSSSSDDSDDTDTADNPADASAADATPHLTVDASQSSDPGTSATDCTLTNSYDDCLSCCDLPTGGQLVAANNAYGACACENDCADVCGGNFCEGGTPSTSCQTCLSNTCEPQADALCTSSACQAGLACLDANSCDSKP